MEEDNGERRGRGARFWGVGRSRLEFQFTLDPRAKDQEEKE